MIRFENEIWFWAMLLIPILALLFWLNLRWRKKAVDKHGLSALVFKMMPSFSMRRQRLKMVLSLLALFFICIGLANPQVGTKLQKVKREGVDVMIAIDVSKSMLAEDIQPNRLERAKQFVSKLIDNMKGDRVGLIVFAGNAYLQMPLTIDYAAAKLFLKSVNTDAVPSQGTSLADAIILAKNNFEDNDKFNKALIIITDGEDHEAGALELAEEAKEQNILIHTLGIGSEEGAKIPETDRYGRQVFKQDKNGQTVVSKINAEFLEELADVSGGRYFRIKGDRKEMATILSELDSMDKKDFEDRVFTDYEDQFQYLLLFAILFLIAELLISERSRGWFRNFNLFESKEEKEGKKAA